MKRYLLALAAALALCVLSTPAALPQSNSLAASLSATVIETKIEWPCTPLGNAATCAPALTIKAVIDGRTFWLISEATRGQLLALGKYKVRLSSDKPSPDGKFSRTYEFLYTSGKTEKFTVIGETK